MPEMVALCRALVWDLMNLLILSVHSILLLECVLILFSTKHLGKIPLAQTIKQTRTHKKQN